MKILLSAILLAGLAGATVAQAQAPAPAPAQSCTLQATDKKLAGAAKTSFLTRCEKDAGASCDKQAADKKLSGAAKTSFTNKCVRDAVGT